MKTVLLTGNLGYIGTILTRELEKKGYSVVGLDSGYFEDCLLEPARGPARQIRKDIRAVDASDFKGIDGVIHLAGLSNDPLGELDSKLTHEINLDGTLKAAKLAREAGAIRFVYASSQSMYGISKSGDELDEDLSEKHPLTAYASAKWEGELGLMRLATDAFTVVAMRPSTVFGASPRLRTDIVFNNFVACAYTTGKIEVKSDGTPWRPAIHILDVCSAFIAGLEAPKALVAGQAFNVGVANGNYSVRDLAEAAQKVVPNATLTFTGEHGSDSRTYRVCFDKIQRVLKDYYKPEWSLERGGRDLVESFRRWGFTEEQFRGRMCARLKQINHLREHGKLDARLEWTPQALR